MTRKKLIISIYCITPIIAFLIGSRIQSENQASNATEQSKSENKRTSVSSSRNYNISKSDASEAKLEALAELANDLNSSNIETIGKAVFEETDPLMRRKMFNLLLDKMTSDNALEIREQVIKLDEKGTEFRDFHFIWGSMAGAEAVIHGASTEETDIQITMEGWVNSSPNEAIEWYKGLDELKINGLYTGWVKKSLVDGLASTNIPQAVDFIKNLSDKGDRKANELIHDVALKLTRTMPLNEVADWATNLPNDGMKKTSTKAIGSAFGYSDPVTASRWASTLDPSVSSEGIYSVGEAWARRDPAASSEWLSSLPESQATNKGIEKALQHWAEHDPKSASDHLVSMPESDHKDRAINGFVSRVAKEDPQAAILWADTIKNESVRNEAFVKAGRAYLRNDSAAANEWLDASGLPNGVKDKINSPKK